MGQVVSLAGYRLNKKIKANETAQQLYERCLWLLMRIYPKMTRAEDDRYVLSRVQRKIDIELKEKPKWPA